MWNGRRRCSPEPWTTTGDHIPVVPIPEEQRKNYFEIERPTRKSFDLDKLFRRVGGPRSYGCGVKIFLPLLETKTFRALDLTLLDPFYPACSVYKFKSDEYWACVAKQSNFNLCHQAGTCKMGPFSDPMTVVDPRLRVHGIRGLRVVDNSIMPRVTGSNTAAPAMMIGERASAFIKEDWGQEYPNYQNCEKGD